MKNRIFHPSFEQLSGEPVSERVFTLDELSKMFNVSTKTISRWRGEGLDGQQLKVDGRQRLGFLASAVEQFVQQNPERVRRGSRFSQLTDTQRAGIIAEARRMVLDGKPSADVIKQLAKQTGRSHETIRYTIKQFDTENPEEAVFAAPNHLTLGIRESIYQAYRRGKSAQQIAKTYKLSESQVEQIILQMRAQRVEELPLEWMSSPEFETAAAEKLIGPMPKLEKRPRKTRAPAGLPAYLASLYETPLLSSEQEVHLFRKYNFLKYRAAKLREQLSDSNLDGNLLDEIEDLYQQAVDTKNKIVQANLRLVVSIVKRFVADNEQLYTLISDGNMSLMRAVEKFDYTRGFKFSTYATWAIRKNYARACADEAKFRDRFKTSREGMLFEREDSSDDPLALERQHRRQAGQLQKILQGLDQRERLIIESRYGLGSDQPPMTLSEVGKQFGVSKERIRQLENRALNKLRDAAAKEKIDFALE